MSSIVFVIPKLYFDAPMSPNLKEKLRLCNEILQALSINQPYLGKYSSRYRRMINNENNLPVWESSHLAAHIMVPEGLFNEAIAILEHDEYISIKGDLLHLTKKGQIFLMKDEGYDYGQHEPLPKYEMILKDGIYIPKPKEETKEIRYQNKMKPKERAAIKRFLKTNNLVNDPAKFVAFLNGENDGEGLEINDHDQNLTAVPLLLKQLRSKGLIELTATNQFQQYFTSHVRPFSVYNRKEQTEQFKKEIRKATNNKWKECPLAKDLEQMIAAFILAGVTVFVIYP